MDIIKPGFYLYLVDFYSISHFQYFCFILCLNYSVLRKYDNPLKISQLTKFCLLWTKFGAILIDYSYSANLILSVLNYELSHSALPFLLSFISEEIFRCFIIFCPRKAHQVRAQKTNMDEFDAVCSN